MHVLIAPDKFKGTLTATEVADALQSGLTSAAAVTCATVPLADGGDGSVVAALSAGYTGAEATVTGPTGDPVHTRIAHHGGTAMVEVASSCGMSTLTGGRLESLRSSSFGLGQAIIHAVDVLGARRVVIGLGGSASTDGGAGMLAALGARFLDALGEPVMPTGGTLCSIEKVDLRPLRLWAGIELIAATDVRNPLLGRDGAAAVFGPQKGAAPTEVALLDRGLAHLACLVTASDPGVAATPGAGSAGGIGFGCLVLGARIVSGAEFFLDLLDFDCHARGADMVVTGEGHLDAQTAHGKLVSVVAARSAGRPVVAVVGRTSLPPGEARRLGLHSVHALADATTADSSADPALSRDLLHQIGIRLATELPTGDAHDGGAPGGVTGSAASGCA